MHLNPPQWRKDNNDNNVFIIIAYIAVSRHRDLVLGSRVPALKIHTYAPSGLVPGGCGGTELAEADRAGAEQQRFARIKSRTPEPRLTTTTMVVVVIGTTIYGVLRTYIHAL